MRFVAIFYNVLMSFDLSDAIQRSAAEFKRSIMQYNSMSTHMALCQLCHFLVHVGTMLYLGEAI